MVNILKSIISFLYSIKLNIIFILFWLLYIFVICNVFSTYLKDGYRIYITYKNNKNKLYEVWGYFSDMITILINTMLYDPEICHIIK